MDTRDLSIIVDTSASRQDRIYAIRQLGIVRQHQKNEQLAHPTSLEELPGRRELQRVIQRQRDPIDVRCMAVTVAAETDNESVLDWCNEMIRQYL